jgi:signal transduction histidine kinase
MPMSFRVRQPLLLLALLIIFNNRSYSQQLSVIANYTLADGLPSNHIYKCLQDKKGFLWIASESGLSRFDGHSFTNFSVKDGLPDNDILDIFLDSTGNIWMLPFSKSPAYFDTKKFKIVDENVFPGLGKIRSKAILHGHSLYNGDVVFYNYTGQVFITGVNNLKGVYSLSPRLTFYTKKDEIELTTQTTGFSKYRKGIITGKADTTLNLSTSVRPIEIDNAFFAVADPCTLVKISNLDEHLAPQIIQKKLPLDIWSISNLKNYLGITVSNGLIYLLDKNTLEIKSEIVTGLNPINICEDKDGYYGISTINNGILKLGNPAITSFTIPGFSSKDMVALSADDYGIAGATVYGHVFEYKNNLFTSSKVLSDTQSLNKIFVKKILKSNKDVYVFTNMGLFKREINSYKKIGTINGYKDAIILNDSTLLMGTFKSLVSFNLNNNHIAELESIRVSALAGSADGSIYVGSNDGLYKWKNNRLENLGLRNNAFTNSITELFTTPDNITWIGSSSDTLMAATDGSILIKIPLRDLSTGSVCKVLAGNKPGVLWAGTDRSLIKINYILSGSKITFSSFPLYKSDGLSEGQVNDIAFFGDSVFVATTTGICKISSGIKPFSKDMPVYITSLYVNGRKMEVQDRLDLQPDENNIRIGFSEVDLSGYMPGYQYRINENNWQTTTENSILLTGLPSGIYSLEIRAINKNNNPSSFISKINFNIKTPLLHRTWFQAMLVLIGFMIALYFINKLRLTKQKRKYEQQLALDNQRFKITADLHDDIGASLSSLQVNSAVANQLINKNPLQAKEVLNKIEEQSKNLSERIGDIIWSMKPGKDEFMTLSTRIKTFASDILGATGIEYYLHISDEVNTAITDFTMRKNIVLIVKEAVNNAVKYSEAKMIIIELLVINKTLDLSIADNGIGILPDSKQGNGLANMEKRAKEMKGNFIIETGEKKGTKIICKIPLP